ncbi:MAG: GTP cyclohydrolase I [Turneriella sp.]|nr:GTP cyclohydrolase I [Leptospiraceae bacterium]MCX7631726.1 GTP cyclohydrolase I [Turneriella sp.]
MTIKDWLAAHIVADPQALAWFAEPESEDRIRRAYRELLSGYAIDTSKILKPTRLLASGENFTGSVTVHEISFYSICAHHFLPFYGKVAITYVPGTMIIGLGKFPRLVQAFSRRFQIQEDLVRQIAEEVMRSGGAKGVRVQATARHLCMCSRGPSDDNAETLTEFALGVLA